MQESRIVLFPILFPILFGLGLLIFHKIKRKLLIGLTGAGLAVTAVSVARIVWLSVGAEKEMACTFFQLTSRLPVFFRVDLLGSLFAAAVTVVWAAAGIFAFEYMKHEEANGRYFGFYMMAYGVLTGLDFSGNLITFYLFYECMTLLSLPLVFHTRTREAVMAGLKYLFYSLAGAYMVLFGLYFVNRYANTLTFTPGGVLDSTLAEGREALLLLAAFLMLLGFGVKAGLFPMHSWLPTAHPAAPAPASAALSGIIVKSGVFGIIRVCYYIFGVQFLRGTWVQTAFLTLALITIFMGSMLAYLERGLKKRLAYSTVSQVSYILFGLGLFVPEAFTGALLHVLFHAVIKCGLFLCAGAVIYRTGKTRVEELAGMGKRMPVTLWCFTILSLALVGIPPASGFVSKWYLAQGALGSGTAVFSWLGPVVLLLSALLTAGYLLPITMKAFYPGAAGMQEHAGMDQKKGGLPGNKTGGGSGRTQEGQEAVGERELSWIMLIPLLFLTALAVIWGMFPGGLVSYIGRIVSQVL